MSGGDLLLVGVVLVLGCAAFFIGVIYLFCSFLTVVGRTMFSFVFPRRQFAPRALLPGRRRNCPNPKCGEVENRAARYCGHCGSEMGA